MTSPPAPVFEFTPLPDALPVKTKLTTTTVASPQLGDLHPVFDDDFFNLDFGADSELNKFLATPVWSSEDLSMAATTPVAAAGQMLVDLQTQTQRADHLQQQLTAATTRAEDLENQLATEGAGQLQQQLTAADARIAELENQLATATKFIVDLKTRKTACVRQWTKSERTLKQLGQVLEKERLRREHLQASVEVFQAHVTKNAEASALCLNEVKRLGKRIFSAVENSAASESPAQKRKSNDEPINIVSSEEDEPKPKPEDRRFTLSPGMFFGKRFPMLEAFDQSFCQPAKSCPNCQIVTALFALRTHESIGAKVADAPDGLNELAVNALKKATEEAGIVHYMWNQCHRAPAQPLRR